MDRLAEILSRINSDESLTDTELSELESELLELFDSVRAGKVDGTAATDVETLRQIASSVELIRVAAAERIAASEAAAAEIAEIEAALRTVEADATDEPAAEIVEPELAELVEPEPEVEVEVEAVAAAAPAPAAPVAPSTAALAARQRPSAQPAPTVPSLDIRSTSGARLSSMRDIAELFVERFDAMGGTSAGYSENVKLAKLMSSYPEDRVLDGRSDVEKIEAVVASATDPDSWTDAMVASGGFCAPTEVVYDFCLIAEAIRPVRDALPSFRADRGGVRYPQSPGLADITSAITVHTDANDIAGDLKNCQAIDCSAFDEFLTQAIVRCLTFGNFGARAFPEQVEHWNALVMAAWARQAETELLDGIVAGSTAVTTPQVFGSARDLIEAVIRAAAQFRSRNRMRSDARLRAMLPSWVPDQAAADLAYGLQSEAGFLTNGREIIRQALANAGVNVSFYVDSPSTGTSQIAPAQAVGALNAWTPDVQWGLWEEGHHVLLDGGSLDLGIVRDSTLNSTNDFQNFAESFEGVASRGCESLWVTSTVCVNGTSGAGVDAVVC